MIAAALAITLRDLRIWSPVLYREGWPERVGDLNGQIAEANGFNCTQGDSAHEDPCTARKVGVLEITRDSPKTLYVNLVAGLAAQADFEDRHRASDVARVSTGGFLRVYRDAPKGDGEEDDEPEDEGGRLPPLKEGDILKLVELKPEEHHTSPPPHYNEASLIRAMEKHGIGRPSTYAPTIKTVVDRGYVRRNMKDRKLIPTELGILVTDKLKAHFPDVVSLTYTAEVEEKLDRIAEGGQGWTAVVREFYAPFVKALDAATTEAQRGAIGFLMNQVYPVKWESVKTDVQPIVWERTGGNGYAKLGDGMAEVKLTAAMDGDKPTVIHNLKYWGAQKNSGFELAYGTHHYRGFGYDYDYENRNGFFITIESSGDSSTSR